MFLKYNFFNILFILQSILRFWQYRFCLHLIKLLRRQGILKVVLLKEEINNKKKIKKVQKIDEPICVKFRYLICVSIKCHKFVINF